MKVINNLFIILILKINIYKNFFIEIRTSREKFFAARTYSRVNFLKYNNLNKQNRNKLNKIINKK